MICNPVQEKKIYFLLVLFCLSLTSFSQMITGIWKGKINRQKVEVKIIQQGDSLTGTSYYFESANNFRRYTIRGYFDAATSEAVWWDDQLVEEKSTRFSITSPGKTPMLSRADFNCPGGNRMMLDGKVTTKENDRNIKGEVHLDKTFQSVFDDEWDFVITNYTIGANDPEVIDSIKSIAFQTKPIAETPVKKSSPEKIITRPTIPIVTKNTNKPVEKIESKQQDTKEINTRPIVIASVKAPNIEEKFVARKKTFIKEIPISGDSIELHFYDNAEIDGDSISLFLNNKLLFQHIRLTGNPYVIKLALSELQDSNELTMVAENLGTIPPNTSYMIAFNNEQRFDAYLTSTEGESATIRLKKTTQ